MNRTIKMCLGVASLSLVACGPGAKIGGGKQGAAEALFAASGPTKESTNPSQGIDIMVKDRSIACQYGGTATLKNFTLKTDTVGGVGSNVGAQYDVSYENCGASNSEAGKVVLAGAWQATQSIQQSTGTVKVAQTFKGKLTFGGAFDDFLDADIVQSVDVNALGTGTGTVAVVLKGTLTNSSGTYTYDEAVNVTAGNVSVAVTKN